MDTILIRKSLLFQVIPEKLEKTVTLSKTVMHTITFKVTDKDTGDVIPDVEVTVKKSGDMAAYKWKERKLQPC